MKALLGNADGHTEKYINDLEGVLCRTHHAHEDYFEKDQDTFQTNISKKHNYYVLLEQTQAWSSGIDGWASLFH